MVALEMMTWKKPFCEYTPEEHQKCVAGLGKRPNLIVNESEQQSDVIDQYSEAIHAENWPSGTAELLRESWSQDVASRLTMQSVVERMGGILANFATAAELTPEKSNLYDNTTLRNEKTEVVLEFPSHFSPRHQLSDGSKSQKPMPALSTQGSRDDSDFWCGDKQSETSHSYQELTMTSTSSSLHDSN